MKDAGMMYATTYGSAITDSSGYFTMTIHLADGIGHRQAYNEVNTLHHYDLMILTLEVYQNSNVSTTTSFYLYCFS